MADQDYTQLLGASLLQRQPTRVTNWAEGLSAGLNPILGALLLKNAQQSRDDKNQALVDQLVNGGTLNEQQQGILRNNPSLAPQVAASMLSPKENKPITVAAGGTVFDPTTNQPIYTAPKESGPLSSLGKLESDRKAGLIDEATYQRELKARDKRGTTTVNVPPTVINNHLPLDKPNTSATQKDVLDINDQLSLLNEAIGSYDSAYQTLPEQIRQGAMSWKQWAGMPLSPDETAAREKYVLAEAAAGQFSAERLNALYGAALTAGEQARARAFIPGDNDDPTSRITKLKRARDTLQAASKRKRLALLKGIDVSDINKVGKVSAADIGSVDKAAGDFLIEKRDELRRSGMNDAAIQSELQNIAAELNG